MHSSSEIYQQMIKNKNTVTVLGATGRVGRLVVDKLAQKNWNVLAVSRSEENAKLVLGKNLDKNVIFKQANLLDPKTLSDAFSESEYLVHIYSPNPMAPNQETHFEKVKESLRAALLKNSIKYIINLSSTNVIYGAQAGPPQWLAKMELFLNSFANINTVHLRSCFFEENLTDLLGRQPLIYNPLNPEIKFAMISIQEISNQVVELLEKPFYQHNQIRIAWPSKLKSVSEILQTKSAELNLPSPIYKQISLTEFKEKIAAQGFANDFIEELKSMYSGINEGLLNQQYK